MINIYNNSSRPFSGWVPLTSPTEESSETWRETYARAEARAPGSATTMPVTIHRGLRRGSSRHVWVQVPEILPMQALQIDLATQVGLDHLPEPIIPEVMLARAAARFTTTVNGQPMAMLNDALGSALTIDGPAVRAHFRAQVGVSTWLDLWIVWCPDEPWFRFEAVFNCAHPHTSQANDHYHDGFDIQVGNSILGFIGQRFGRVLVNERMAQGQSRAFAGVGAWLDLCSDAQKDQLPGMLLGAPFALDTDWRDCVGGMGAPDLQERFSTRAWVNRSFTALMQSMHTWNTSAIGLGVVAASGVTGAQEEQCFGANVGECFQDGDEGLIGPVALFMRYVLAMTYSRRPCHYREADGELLRFDSHPNLVMWSGTPHWHPNVSPDRLGLPYIPNIEECHGWSGPDRQHWFYGSLWGAAAMVQSDALQMELEQQARLVWFGETVRPGWSTSTSDASRAVGWACMVIVGLAHTLANSATRERVLQRARERIDLVYVPELDTLSGIWQPTNDVRVLNELAKHFENISVPGQPLIPRADVLPPFATSWTVVHHWSHGWIVYQQAVGAFGLFVLSRLLDHGRGMIVAKRAAARVFADGWKQNENGAWVEWEILAYLPGGEPLPQERYVPGDGSARTGWFRHAWMPLALYVAGQDGNTAASSLLIDLRREAATGAGASAWLPAPYRQPMPFPVG